MPKYHFDVRQNGTDLRDDEGEECGDRQAAEAQAKRVAVDMIDSLKSESQLSRTIEVREDGRATNHFSVCMSSARLKLTPEVRLPQLAASSSDNDQASSATMMTTAAMKIRA